MHADTITRVHNVIKEANMSFPSVNLENVNILFDLRGKTAGYAGRKHGRWFIRLNRDLMATNPSQMMDEVIPHEVAHLVVMYLQSIGMCRRTERPHGALWKTVCKRLGGNGERCHSMEVQRVRKTKVYAYNIDGTILWVSATRHNRIMSETCTYSYKGISVVSEKFTGEWKFNQ